MTSHNDRTAKNDGSATSSRWCLDRDFDNTAWEDAAEAVREAEIEAVQPVLDAHAMDSASLNQMNIDELRLLAKQLDVPDRATIIEKDDLIAAIRCQVEAPLPTRSRPS